MTPIELNATSQLALLLIVAAGAWWGWTRLRAQRPAAPPTAIPAPDDAILTDDAILADDEVLARLRRLEAKVDLLLARGDTASSQVPTTQADITRLHDAGHSAEQIAETLQLARGEVELVLRMRETRLQS
jgi:hypothetical protein